MLNEYLREFQAKLKASLEHAERSNNAKEADRLRKILLELDEYEHDVLYPLASQNIAIDLDDGVKANYPKFGSCPQEDRGLGGDCMSEVSAVRPHLERRFADQRVVFWHDPQGQYAADLDGLDLPGVTTLRVANDEYAHQAPVAPRTA
ncbi:MAG: hypothetical protein V9G13_14635 [Marmoricola sp.]